MKARAFMRLGAFGVVVVLSAICEGAFITWTNLHPEGPSPVRDQRGQVAPGTVTFGEPIFSNGALVQLWKAVGGPCGD